MADKRKTCKTFEELRPDWEELITSMSEEGAHKTEVIKELGITEYTHAKFMTENEEYARVFKEGDTLAEAFYHRTLRTNLGNRNFNNILLIFYFKARFGFNDQTPQAPKSGGRLLPDHVESGEIEEKYKQKGVIQ
jgi:hypothetical protein